MKSVWLAGIVGAVILFIWSSVSWMVLPWHMKTIHSFKDEASVTAVLTANVDKSGMYMLPSPNYDKSPSQADTARPMVFAAVSLQGMGKMSRAMVIYFVIQLAAALLVAFMLAQTSLVDYLSRVAFIMVFALATAILSCLPYWSWWGFDLTYTLVAIADLLIGWFLAGLVIAALVKRPSYPVVVQ